MRIVGYAFLFGGFLWLLENIYGFSQQRDAAVDNIIRTELFPSIRGGQIPCDVASRALKELRDKSRIRYSLLPPAYMMLAGGLVLGLRASKRPTIPVIDGNPPWPGIKSKLEDVRRDIGAARHSEKTNSFRGRLLGLIRRAVARSSYFRSRGPDEGPIPSKADASL